jgi:ribose transport system substrate-binding protein
MKLAWVGSDMTNASAAGYGQAVATAAKALGWTTTMLNAKGTTDGASAAVDEAIALHVNGIATDYPSPGIQPALQRARAAGIFIVGIHSSATPGPDASQQLYYNVSQDPAEIGKATADWAIADSNGTAKVVIVYDSLYPVSVDKANAMKATIETCSGCQVLAFDDSPLADVTTRAPALATSLVNQFGQSFYILTIADTYLDAKDGRYSPAGPCSPKPARQSLVKMCRVFDSDAPRRPAKASADMGRRALTKS